MAYQFNDELFLFQIDMERSKNPVLRMDDIGFLLCTFYKKLITSRWNIRVVIEGVGFGSSQYRQVELAEVRTTIALWFRTRKVDVESILLPAPNAIRKAVFGFGKTKAHQFWDNSEIPNDALTALSCLCYASIVNKGNET